MMNKIPMLNFAIWNRPPNWLVAYPMILENTTKKTTITMVTKLGLLPPAGAAGAGVAESDILTSLSLHVESCFPF